MAQVSSHLRDMGLVECCNDLRVDYDKIIDDKVGHQRSDVLFLEINRKALLLVYRMIAQAQFNNHGTFIQLLIKSGLEFVEHIINPFGGGPRRPENTEGKAPLCQKTANVSTQQILSVKSVSSVVEFPCLRS